MMTPGRGFRSDVAGRMRTALFELSPKAQWTDRMKRAAGALKSFSLQVDPQGALSVGLNVDAVEGVADHGDLSLDMTDLLVAVGEAAHTQHKGVVLLLDEIQFLDKSQLEAVIAAIHKTVQRELPVTLVGAGLPQIAELAGDAKSYAERLFKFPRIGNLDPTDAKRALTEPAAGEGVTYSDEALDLAVTITGGYPYFLQELDMRCGLWSRATESNSRTFSARCRSMSPSSTRLSSASDWTVLPNSNVPI